MFWTENTIECFENFLTRTILLQQTVRTHFVENLESDIPWKNYSIVKMPSIEINYVTLKTKCIYLLFKKYLTL